MNVPLVLAVVVISGVVAYVGDVIGKRLGKKRVTVFGLRPRQTAVVIAVATGCLITTGTILALAAASQDVRQAIFHLGELREQIETAEARAAEAQAGRERAEAELLEANEERDQTLNDLEQARVEKSNVEGQLYDARADADAASGEARQARGILGHMRAQLDQFTDKIAELQGHQSELETSVATISQEAAEATRARDQAIQEVGRYWFHSTLFLYGYSGRETGLHVFEPGEELARVIIPAGSGILEARDGVDRVVEEAKQRAEAAGCKPFELPDDIVATEGLYLILRWAEARIGENWKLMGLDERLAAYDAYLDDIAAEAEAAASGDRVCVSVVVEEFPTPRNRPAIVDLRVASEKPAVMRGESLATRAVPEDADANAIAAMCPDLVRAAREYLLDKPGRLSADAKFVWPSLTLRSLTFEEVDWAVAEVMRLRAQGLKSRLSLVATEDSNNIEEPSFRLDVDAAL